MDDNGTPYATTVILENYILHESVWNASERGELWEGERWPAIRVAAVWTQSEEWNEIVVFSFPLQEGKVISNLIVESKRKHLADRCKNWPNLYDLNVIVSFSLVIFSGI